MTEHALVTDALISHAVAAFVRTGLGDPAGVRGALEAARNRNIITVGDVLQSTCGTYIGLVLSIYCGDLLISWARRSISGPFGHEPKASRQTGGNDGFGIMGAARNGAVV